MSSGISARKEVMQAVAKSIVDITELVSLLQRGLGQGTTWERQLAAHLVDVDRLLNLLRLTVAMLRQIALHGARVEVGAPSHFLERPESFVQCGAEI